MQTLIIPDKQKKKRIVITTKKEVVRVRIIEYGTDGPDSTVEIDLGDTDMFKLIKSLETHFTAKWGNAG